jgi:hypothetical protein
MKINQYLLFIPILTMSCHTPIVRTAHVPLETVDTTKAISHPDPLPENDPAVVLKTHLRDTTYAAGSFILFLRPDDARYAELEKEAENETGDEDADFGVGISATRDSVKENDRYKDIKVLTSATRYICIKDCKDGPFVIDRDSITSEKSTNISPKIDQIQCTG